MALMLVCVVIARAAEPDTPVVPAFAAYLARADHRNAVLEVARWSNIDLPTECRDMTFAIGKSVRIFNPPRFDEAGEPVLGAWAEDVEGTGCGRKVRFNVFTRVDLDRFPKVEALMPGETRADPPLQREILTRAFKVVSDVGTSCDDRIVTDTRFAAFEGSGDAIAEKRPWRETWIVEACGKRYDVPVHFLPYGHGTAVRVIPTEVKLEG